MPNEETIKQAITRMQGIDLNEFVRLVEYEINKRALKKALEFTKPDNSVMVWVSWSSIHDYADPQISVNKPIELDDMNGKAYSHYSVKSTENVTCTCPDLIAKLLGFEPGQCKQFLITEVSDG